MIKVSRKIKIDALVLVAGLVLAACNHVSTPEPIATPIQPQVTETIPVYETPGATKTPFVEVTPIEGVDNTLEATPISERLTIEDIGPEDKIYHRGKGFQINADDLAVETGIIVNTVPNEYNWDLETESELYFGETGLRFAWLSAYVADEIIVDKETNMLIVPLAIEVNGSLVHFKAISSFEGNNRFLSFSFLKSRGSLPGYDFETDRMHHQTFPNILDFPVKLEVGKQILIKVPDPESKQQYIDGLVHLRNAAIKEGLAETDRVIMEIDFALENIESEEGYAAYVKLKNKTIRDGSVVFMYISSFRVTEAMILSD